MADSNVMLADQCAIYVAAYLYYIEVKSKARLLDITILAESFARGLVTTVFGYESLINLNLKNGTYPAVDIATSNGDIAFQVTISGGSEKIESTLETFMKNQLDKNYKRLVFIILGDKQGSYESKKIAENAGTFAFDPYVDIYDLRQLYDLLVQEGSSDKFLALRDLIASALGPKVSTLLVGYKRTEDNLNNLFRAHDVVPTLGAEAMQKFGIDRPTFCNVDRLNQCMTHEMSEYLANEFAVASSWIIGESIDKYDNFPDCIRSTGWRRNLFDAYELVEKYHNIGGNLSVVIPCQLSIDDFQTLPSAMRTDNELASKDHYSANDDSYYFVVARSVNSFRVNCYRLLADEPIPHSKMGLYLLFLAAEIWRLEHDGSSLIGVQTVDYRDMQIVRRGELFLVDVLRGVPEVRNHADYICMNKGVFEATNISTSDVRKLQSELKIFINRHKPKQPEGIPIPSDLQ